MFGIVKLDFGSLFSFLDNTERLIELTSKRKNIRGGFVSVLKLEGEREEREVRGGEGGGVNIDKAMQVEMYEFNMSPFRAKLTFLD